VNAYYGVDIPKPTRAEKPPKAEKTTKAKGKEKKAKAEG
jgi:hypothetical protein